MIKRRITTAYILCLAICIVLLSGCGNNNNNNNSNNGVVAGDSVNQTAGDQNNGGTDEPNIIVPDQIEDEESEPVYAEAIIIISDGKLPTLDPMQEETNTIPTAWAFTMIHDRLLTMDAETGELNPALATQWNSADSRTFNFRLRDDAVFHDGEKLTAQDVVFTVNRGKESPGSEAYALWSQVETAKVINDFEVEFLLTGASLNFYSDLATPTASILSEFSIKNDPEFGPAIGTGAYAVIDFQQDDYVQMVRNETYWGASKSILTDWVRLQCVPDTGTRIGMMQNGEAQVCYGLPNDDIDIFKNDPDNFDVYTHYDVNGVVCAQGIGGIVWRPDARNIDLREIHWIIDWIY